MKILVIKLGALGDVVRTLPILPALKEKFPQAEIHWVTKKNALELFYNNKYVGKVFALEEKNLLEEEYDKVYNFEIEEEATDLAMKIQANDKKGFGKGGDYATALNPAAEYYLNTVFDDALKKENKKTYQEMMFEAAELPYSAEKYRIELILSDEEIKNANKFALDNRICTEKLIGIHVGAGKRWHSKAWHLENVRDFIRKTKERGYEIILFGGPDEVESHAKISSELLQEGIKIHMRNTASNVREFISLVNLCKYMVCSESFALYISLALNKKTICLIFCTSPDEVEGYGVLNKVIAPRLYDFFPERSDVYSEELVR